MIEQVVSVSTLDPVTGCLIWGRGRDRDGYGKVCIEGKHWRVSRALLFVTTNELYPVARHTCDNPPCCRLSHLLWGTYRDNKLDAVERGRAVCNFRGMPGETNGRSKLTDEQRIEIRCRRLAGERAKDLAEEFGVSRGTIGYLVPGLKPGPGKPEPWQK